MKATARCSARPIIGLKETDSLSMDRVLEKLGRYPCLEWAIALIPVVLEFMQQFDLCPGIFDIYDLVCYITPIVMFFKIV